jgi:hypothetical protein
VLEIKEITKLYERTTQIWTSLGEDERIQQLDQREEKINSVVQDIKQRKKEMSISYRLKRAHEMNNLEVEIRAMKEEKQA